MSYDGDVGIMSGVEGPASHQISDWIDKEVQFTLIDGPRFYFYGGDKSINSVALSDWERWDSLPDEALPPKTGVIVAAMQPEALGTAHPDSTDRNFPGVYIYYKLRFRSTFGSTYIWVASEYTRCSSGSICAVSGGKRNSRRKRKSRTRKRKKSRRRNRKKRKPRRTRK